MSRYFLKDEADVSHEDCGSLLREMKAKLFSKRELKDFYFADDSYSEDDDTTIHNGSDRAICSFSYLVQSPNGRVYRAIFRALKSGRIELRIEFRSGFNIENIYPCLMKVVPFDRFDSEFARILTELFVQDTV